MGGVAGQLTFDPSGGRSNELKFHNPFIISGASPLRQSVSDISPAKMSLNCVSFFERGTAEQFQWVLGKYEEALTAKAEKKNSKPEALIKLDKWFHNDLPKKIKSRGKDAHLTHEEICKVGI